jgi:peroxiredoxin
MKYLASIFLLLTFSIFAFGQQNAGVAAHNFSAITIGGDNVELNQLKGKVAVLTFWSTRCEICIAEMPKLNKLVDKYDSNKVEFIGLTMNNEMMVQNFLKKKTFKFTIIPNSLGVVLKYADRDSKGRLLMGYPAYYIVNQKGDVVLKASGFDKVSKIDQTINQLLKSE